MNKKRNISIILYHLAYSGVVSTVILKLMLIDKSGILASYTNIFVLCGTFLSGLLGNIILSKYSKNKIGIIANLISFTLATPFIIYTRVNNNIYIYLMMFILSGIHAISVANMNPTIPLIFEKKYISKIFSNIQVLLQVITLVISIVLNIFVGIINIDIIILSFFLVYLISAIPWLCIRTLLMENKSEGKNKVELILEEYS